MLQFARMHLPMVKKTRSQKFALKGDSKRFPKTVYKIFGLSESVALF